MAIRFNLRSPQPRLTARQLIEILERERKKAQRVVNTKQILPLEKSQLFGECYTKLNRAA